MEKCAELRKKQSESPDNAIFVVGLTTPTSPATVIKISKEELQFIEELEGGVPSEEVAPREVIDIDSDSADQRPDNEPTGEEMPVLVPIVSVPPLEPIGSVARTKDIDSPVPGHPPDL